MSLLRAARRFLPVGLILCASPVCADLAEYLKKPDPSYAWELVRKSDAVNATLYELRLTSQTWQGITWQHNLNVFIPHGVAADLKAATAGSALLMIDGGNQSSLERKPGMESLMYGSMLAQKVGVPLAVLRQVPNQPLLDGLVEDALIAETFKRYLDSGDPTWPLLFPMTKSAIRAIDALGEFSERELGGRIDKVVVTGGSKRGWTTWLTAASDPRVIAIAPMVIDMLHSKPQMEHQVKVLGAWSDATRDYHSLMRREDTEPMQRLWSMVDPFTFRDKITQPKLIILGNNDPYWATDALNIYWEGLSSPKWIHYVPNAGHDLMQRSTGQVVPPLAAINALGIFTRLQLTGKTFPTLEWKHDESADRPRLSVTASEAPKGARLWVANADTHDFRKARWEERPMKLENGSAVGQIDLPTSGSSAFYAALDFEHDGVPYYLCTQMRIVDAPAPQRR